MGDERQCGDARLEQLPALLEFQWRSDIRKRSRDIAHRDRPLQRWRKAAARDSADFTAFAVEHERPFPNRLAALDVESDALLRRSTVELGEDSERSGEASL